MQSKMVEIPLLMHLIYLQGKGTQNSEYLFFMCCLQRSIDDKFRCVEEREGQVRRLQLALREKERDLERLRCIFSSNEETITVCSWHNLLL